MSMYIWPCNFGMTNSYGRNHWVLKEENSLLWHTVVINWINKFVGLPTYKDEKEQGYEVQNWCWKSA